MIPYNYYKEGVVPTWEKENYEEAVLFTLPRYERKTIVYTDDEKQTFISMPEKEGFRVTVDSACKRRIVIVIGKVQVFADVEAAETFYDDKTNRTVAVLAGDWTVLEVK